MTSAELRSNLIAAGNVAGAKALDDQALRHRVRNVPRVDPDSLEQRFLRRWEDAGGPPLTEQYVFHPSRKWRFDFAHEPSKVAIEIHGGIHSGGRHVRGTGFQEDRVKLNAARAMGWVVFELTAEMMNDPAEIQQVLDSVRRNER